MTPIPTPTVIAPFTVRRMTSGDLALMRAWAEAEGWNPGVSDMAAFYAADPEGFFLGESAVEPVACVSCVRYGKDFGFLGQYIVRPEYRGRGFGVSVWNAGMAHLAGRNVGLDGVLGQVPNYERSGFRLAHETVRYAGVGGGDRPGGLVGVENLKFADVADYDSACFAARRESFLRAWLANPAAIGLGAVAGGRLTGYAVLRKCIKGWKVGPLFADDAGIAGRLMAGLAAAIPGEPFTIDVPDVSAQPGGGGLVDRFGLVEVFRTARMYTAGEPAFDRSRFFGVTSLELG